MSVFAKPERNAIARQAAAALRQYQATVDRWVLAPGDLDQYSKFCSEIESIRALSSSALPQATGALTQLLLAHTDLTFVVLKKHLVRLGAIAEDGHRVAEARETHRVAVEEMCALCERIGRGGNWYSACNGS